jgi:hypothetical protein
MQMRNAARGSPCTHVRRCVERVRGCVRGVGLAQGVAVEGARVGCGLGHPWTRHLPHAATRTHTDHARAKGTHCATADDGREVHRQAPKAA